MILRLLILLALVVAASVSATVASAAVPVLSFERGGEILANPRAGDIALRSANVAEVRLRLYHIQDTEVLNQIMAARASQSITEAGLQQRVMAAKAPRWQANFVLSSDRTASALSVPLEVAAGPLTAGYYVLVASPQKTEAAGDSVALQPAVQWFFVSDLALHAFAFPVGQLVITTNRAAAVATGNTRLTLLDSKGATTAQNPNNWQTDATGAVFWQGPWPDNAVLLRAEDGRGHVAFTPLNLAAANGREVAAAEGRATDERLLLEPQFSGASVPAGSTAAFNVSLQDETRPARENLRYEFIRLTHSYRWLRDKDNMWRYQVIATPTVIERGLLRPRGDGASRAPLQLLLAVTEGRFRLNVSTADGALRRSFDFTAGWWRALPQTNQDLDFSTKWEDANALSLVADDMPETDAPRWVLAFTSGGPVLVAGNAARLTLPAERLPETPLLAAMCAPASAESGVTQDRAISCHAKVVPAAPASAGAL